MRGFVFIFMNFSSFFPVWECLLCCFYLNKHLAVCNILESHSFSLQLKGISPLYYGINVTMKDSETALIFSPCESINHSDCFLDFVLLLGKQDL